MPQRTFATYPPSPPHRPVLVGRIRISSDAATRPFLAWSGYCPHCRRKHNHGWSETRPRMLFRSKEHRCTHCTHEHGISPFDDRGYYIALDPDWKAEAKEAVAGLVAAQMDWDRWQAERQAWKARRDTAGAHPLSIPTE